MPTIIYCPIKSNGPCPKKHKPFFFTLNASPFIHSLLIPHPPFFPLNPSTFSPFKDYRMKESMNSLYYKYLFTLATPCPWDFFKILSV